MAIVCFTLIAIIGSLFKLLGGVITPSSTSISLWWSLSLSGAILPSPITSLPTQRATMCALRATTKRALNQSAISAFLTTAINVWPMERALSAATALISEFSVLQGGVWRWTATSTTELITLWPNHATPTAKPVSLQQFSAHSVSVDISWILHRYAKRVLLFLSTISVKA